MRVGVWSLEAPGASGEHKNITAQATFFLRLSAGSGSTASLYSVCHSATHVETHGGSKPHPGSFWSFN